jgi:hypothetical protein
MPANDYSKKILPYGSGSTRKMPTEAYLAIADTLRYESERPATDAESAAIRRVTEALADRFAEGNPRFRRATFINAATNAAYGNAPDDDSNFQSRPMKPSELGRYVCVAHGGCLKSPKITIESDGVWVRSPHPDPLSGGKHLYTSAHRDCFEAWKASEAE